MLQPSVEVQNLFARAQACTQSGHLNQALSLYEELLILEPNHLDAIHQLGFCAYTLGDPHRAVLIFQQLLAFLPDHCDVLNSLGLALNAAARNDEAETCFRRCLTLRPHDAIALNNLGIVLRSLRRSVEAVDAYREAVRVEPHYASAHNNLGNVLRDLGESVAAVEEYRQAVSCQPHYADAWSNLGIALGELGKRDEAIVALREAVRLRPDLPLIRANLAFQLMHNEQLDESLDHYHHVLRMDAACAIAHVGIGDVHKLLGNIETHVDILNAHLHDVPPNPRLLDVRLLALHYHPDFDMQSLAREHRRWAASIEAACTPFPHHNDRSPDRPLRIGYVSSDFRDHTVALNILPLFQHRNREQFHTTCYMLSSHHDAMTNTIRSNVDAFRTLVGKTPDDIGAEIQADVIDILVDLALHSDGNGLPVFAHKPAPVQITFAGYPSSTGLTRMDYRLTDPILDPPGLFDPFYSESSLRLDGSFWCYQAIAADVAILPLPARSNGHVTFISLNHPSKVNRRVLELWAKVLVAVPDSRLLLLYPESAARENLLHIFTSAGISKDRIRVQSRVPRDQYIQLYHQADIMLDTFPYNGHTTSLDALWMGVPVVTRTGSTTVGRAGFSQLTLLDLADLAAHTDEEFISISSTLAADLDRLQALRTTLRQRMQSSVLMDGPRLARNIEHACRTAWRTWCSSPP
jgi:protein O-GlcNAc transferase